MYRIGFQNYSTPPSGKVKKLICTKHKYEQKIIKVYSFLWFQNISQCVDDLEDLHTNR
jgi:hypothetical protein